MKRTITGRVKSNRAEDETKLKNEGVGGKSLRPLRLLREANDVEVSDWGCPALQDPCQGAG